MEYRMISVGSITFAQRARNLLNGKGLNAFLVRTGKNGCSYGVRVETGELEAALNILRAAGMNVEVV